MTQMKRKAAILLRKLFLPFPFCRIFEEAENLFLDKVWSSHFKASL